MRTWPNIDLRRALSLAIDREVLEGKIVKGEAIPVFAYAGGFDPAYKGPQIAEAALTQAEREAMAQELYAKAGYGPDNPLKVNIVSTVSEDQHPARAGRGADVEKGAGGRGRGAADGAQGLAGCVLCRDLGCFCRRSGGRFRRAGNVPGYMRPSAEPGYNWVKPEYDAAMDAAAAIADPMKRYEALAPAEKILLDDYIFAPISIVPGRHLVKPGVHGWAASAAGYNNTQFLTLD